MDLIGEIRAIYDNYDFDTEILAASIRTRRTMCKRRGPGRRRLATIPPSVLKLLVKHPLTDKGIETFSADWKKTGQKI